MGDVVRLPIVQPTPEQERNRVRSGRARAVRKQTISIRQITQVDLEFGRRVADAILKDLGDVGRPRARGDCENDERPCPFIACKHHLYLDATEKGSIVLNFPDIEPDALEQMPATCALDIADEGGAFMERVGQMMNMTRERVRQVEEIALRKLQRQMIPLLADLRDDGRDPGLARAHVSAEREAGSSHIDARDAWTVADEFLVPEFIERTARK